MIDYARLARAIAYYQAQGYEYLEAPWAVSCWALDATKPPEAPVFDFLGSGLVASAEQSFLQLMRQGVVRRGGRYVACTPCFSKEASYDELTRPYFMKVELIATGLDDLTIPMQETAWEFMRGEVRATGHEPFGQLASVPTREGYDLELGGIEVGSYGRRWYEGYAWTYGTGIAEPRFSVALQRVGVRCKERDDAELRLCTLMDDFYARETRSREPREPARLIPDSLQAYLADRGVRVP